MGSQQNDSENFYIYNRAFWEFEKFIEKINKNNINQKSKKYEGYLVYLDDFNTIKENIKYDIVKNFFEEENSDEKKFRKLYDSLKSEQMSNETNLRKMEQKKFNSFFYFCYKIMCNTDFIIITDNLWKVIGNKENGKKNSIKYSIEKSSNTLILYYDDNELSFRYENNYIKKDLLNNKEKINKIPTSQEIEKYIKSIIEYNNFEILFSKEAKENK